jgi:hypothetical protein
MALLRPETMKARHVVTTKVVTTWLFSEEFKMGEGKIDLGRVSSIIDVLNARATIQSDQLSYVFLSDGAEADRLTFAQLQRRARAVFRATEHKSRRQDESSRYLCDRRRRGEFAARLDTQFKS